ncbi:MAG: hypothetical protein M3Y33_11425, partial [Actinomycetota bacterium]|nr:hypothetical protein [Actinomycetota bacterium]
MDRLERFHQLKGRQADDHQAGRAHGRPLRDRAMIYLLLSTGLRREELVNLDLAQLAPATPAGLRTAKRARLTGVCGKGNTTRTNSPHVAGYLRGLASGQAPLAHAGLSAVESWRTAAHL